MNDIQVRNTILVILAVSAVIAFLYGQWRLYQYLFDELDTKQIQKEMKDNELNFIYEDLELIQTYLDDKDIPLTNEEGQPYSILGRIKLLETKYLKQLSDLETKYNIATEKDWVIKEDNICPATNQPCDDECCPTGAVCNLKPNEFWGGLVKLDNGRTEWIIEG